MARIFISYSRKDGEPFANDLRARLIHDAGIPKDDIWRDRNKMRGGEGWWKQITDAIDAVDFMVLVATPAAIASKIVRKEWRYARQAGVCVFPVQVPDLPADFAAMPQWMRDSHFYNLGKEWETFVNHLKSPCTATKVPFMAPDMPERFVQRPREFDALKKQLLDANFDNPVAITTALKGAGGFGKTTLAAALCHDDDVQTAFDEGVLWVTLGEKPNLINKLTVLYRALTGENPGFVEVQEGATLLADKLVDADVLLVVDDVWNTAHLRPFLRGGERTARLVTTRFSNIAVDANASLLSVDEMTPAESVTLLSAGVWPSPDNHDPDVGAQRAAPLHAEFVALAARLGEWPLMLEITNGMLREELLAGSSLDDALAYVNEVLDDEGIHGMESEDGDERKRSAAGVLAASLRQLKPDEIPRLCELSIFFEDTDVPLTSVEALWGLSSTRTRKLLTRFDRGSFVRFDRARSTIRLHDVVREVLSDRLDDPAAVHGRLLENYGLASPLPAQRPGVLALPDDYAWRNLAYHLTGAGRAADLHALLLDPDFLQAKLRATDPNALTDDCDALPDDDAVRLVKSALSMSSHILNKDPAQLLTQVYGRWLAHREAHPEIAALLDAIATHETQPALLTRTQTLQPAGGSLVRTFVGHTDDVNAVALSADGRYALSGSWDDTLKLWDVATGAEIRTFEGHTDEVNAVAFSPDGRTALSGSWDDTLKLWDVATGAEIRTFEGHTRDVNAAAFSVDGRCALSGSDDHTLKLWDVATGAELRTFEGHTGYVEAVGLSADGRYALSGSRDATLKLWEVETGRELRTFEGHTHWVNAVALSADGRYALSGSVDTTLKLWDVATGAEIRTFEGHTDDVNAVALSADGRTVLSGSDDETLKLWDVATGAELRTFRGHTSVVSAVAFSPTGRTALSGAYDKTLKLWDVSGIDTPTSARIDTATSSGVDTLTSATGAQVGTFRGHTSVVSAVAFSPNGLTALSGSFDKTLKLWDVETGAEVRTFSGHTHGVSAVAFSPDGRTALSGSWDNTLKLWEVATGAELRTFAGHTKWVNAVALSADGRYALSGSNDKTLKLWDVATGTELRTFSGHTDMVLAVSLSADGRTALSGSRDKTLKLWDIETGEILDDVADTPEARARLWREHGVTLDPVQGDVQVQEYGDSVRVWGRAGDPPLFVFTAEATIWAADLSPGLAIVAGDWVGHVHVLVPNAALRRLLRG